MRSFFIGMFFLLITNLAHGQLYRNSLYVGLNTFKPLTDKEFIDRTSSAGVQIGFSKMSDENWAFGIEIGYSTLHDYIPRKTYEFPNRSITTDIYNYLYYLSIIGNAQYYFAQVGKFSPYAAVGVGIAFNEYRMYYNVFAESESLQSFVARPEVGTLFRLKDYSRWGLKAAVTYDYVSKRSEKLDIDNLTGIGLLVGVVIFSD